MKPIRKLHKAARMIGIDPVKPLTFLGNLPWYLRDYRMLKRQAVSSRFHFEFARPRPCLEEKNAQSGEIGGHYFLQDLHVAGRVYRLNPERHIDIGSRIDGFVAHVASFREIEVLDIRPMDMPIPNVRFRQADLMSLPEDLVESTDSLSCLHTIEHFGLGRYGDPVDFDGFDKGLRNMRRILKPGGTFHFSTPMGPQRIEFNAHRIFSARFLIDYFTPDFDIVSVNYIDSKPRLHTNIPHDHPGIDTNFGCSHGCAILEMHKR